MATDPQFNVIVCTRNRAEYLGQCFQSIAAQKCSAAFEVVVVDNSSTDNTSAIIRQWCEKDRRFRTTQERRLGLSQAKNAGVKFASGEILIFTDDDVIADPNWIEAYRNFFASQANDLVIAGGPIVPIPHDLAAWPEWFSTSALVDIGLLDYREQRKLSNWEWLWGANMAIPAKLFDRLGTWDERVGRRGDERGTFEDTELQDRFRKMGGTVHFCPAAVIHHRIDRHTVTPTRVFATAYARGRNDVYSAAIPHWQEIERIPKRNALACLFKLMGNMILWLIWLLLFRLAPRKYYFMRARDAAFNSGRCLDLLRVGRKSLRLFQTVGRLAFSARNILLRFAPDTP